ncbi:MAG TPA: DapH/DapD/GlmU-related protein [Baekduia sp.]|nr:DapH/DapD/GlmU-related protein [Baekduia sp.]
MCAALRRSERESSAAAEVAVAPPAALPRSPGWRDRRRLARAIRDDGIVVEGDDGAIVIGRRVRFDVAPGGRVVLGAGVALGDGCRLHVGAEGCVTIGAGTALGERCVLTAHDRITVGARCLLADEVVLVDGNPSFDDVERPLREQGVVSAPITIGDGVRIGPSAAVLPGVTVGTGAAIGAHAVVTQSLDRT